MGKIRTRMLGLEDIEKKQKEDQKKKALEKKSEGAEEQEQSHESEQKKTKKSEAKKETSTKRTHGKKYLLARKQISKEKKMKIDEAVDLLKKVAYASFDESVELHMNVDQAGLRGEIELPHATGKKVRVAIVNESVLEALSQNKIEFDILITHPSFMPKLARFAKILGPRGLMPNPKAGTISPKPEEVAKKFEKGTLRWKTEAKFPLIHQMIGKLSYDREKLIENAASFIKAVGKAHIKSVFIASTMGPAIEVEVGEE